MGKINLKWSGATDDQGIAGYDLYYTLGPAFDDNARISIPFISNTSGGGSYSHTITSFVDHKFAIRTMDTATQYSEYKYLTVLVSPQVLISSIGYSSAVGVCSYTSTNPIILTPSQIPTAYSSYVNNMDNSVFNGTDMYWRIAYIDNTFYSCKINNVGLITNVALCSISLIVNSLFISTMGYSTVLGICNSIEVADTIMYYKDILSVGNLLYTTYNNGILSNLYNGYDNYRIMSDGSSSYIVKIGTGVDIGKILSMQLYSIACPVNSGGGGGCPDPETLIYIKKDVQTFAGSIKVGDFVYTIHETTGEYGEYEVVHAELIEQEKLLIIFDDNTEIKVSDTHKFLMIDGEWKQSYKLLIGDSIRGIDFNKVIKSIDKIGIGLVIKFEINDAHTYISAGLISHNLKQAI